MEREDRPAELHTEVDEDDPLEFDQSRAMGEQAVRRLRDIAKQQQTVDGEVDEGFENEDQADAHHAEPGEHL